MSGHPTALGESVPGSASGPRAARNPHLRHADRRHCENSANAALGRARAGSLATIFISAHTVAVGLLRRHRFAKRRFGFGQSLLEVVQRAVIHPVADPVAFGFLLRAHAQSCVSYVHVTMLEGVNEPPRRSRFVEGGHDGAVVDRIDGRLIYGRHYAPSLPAFASHLASSARRSLTLDRPKPVYPAKLRPGLNRSERCTRVATTPRVRRRRVSML